jgi:hypothetical protein
MWLGISRIAILTGPIDRSVGTAEADDEAVASGRGAGGPAKVSIEQLACHFLWRGSVQISCPSLFTAKEQKRSPRFRSRGKGKDIGKIGNGTSQAVPLCLY